MEELTTVRCVLRSRPQISALAHVVATVDAFLDVSVHYTLPNAVATGSVRVFERVLARVNRRKSDPGVLLHWLSRAMQSAIKSGDMSMIQRIHEYHPEPLYVNVFQVAAEYGRLEQLEWLLAHRSDGICCGVPPSQCIKGGASCCLSRASRAASDNGHLQLVKWLYTEGYIQVVDGLGNTAAGHGDLELIKWLYALGDPRAFSSAAWWRAVTKGHLHIVQFLHQHQVVEPERGLLAIAVVNGHTEVATYLQEHDISTEIPIDIVVSASAAGRLDLLQAYDEYLDPSRNQLDKAISVAMCAGHLDIVEWLIARNTGRPLPPFVLDQTTEHGHLKILQWLHEHGVEGWGAHLMDIAAEYGHLEVVQWLHEHRPEGCTTQAMDTAAKNGHLHVVGWLHRNRVEGCTAQAMDEAARHGHLDVLLWLDANRIEGFTEAAISNAASGGYLDLIQWLLFKRPDVAIPASATETAARAGRFHVLEFLCFKSQGVVRASTAIGAGVGGHIHILRWLNKHYPDRIQHVNPIIKTWLNKLLQEQDINAS